MEISRKLQFLDKLEVKHHGSLPQHKLHDILQSCDYWLYPCRFCETFCITSMEMQYARVLNISSNLAALDTTVADRGILVNLGQGIESKQFQDTILKELFHITENLTKKNELLDSAERWAQSQTWDKKIEEWIELMSDGHVTPQAAGPQEKQNIIKYNFNTGKLYLC